MVSPPTKKRLISSSKDSIKLKPLVEHSSIIDLESEGNAKEKYKKSPFYFIDKVKKGKMEDGFIYLNRVVENGVVPYNPYHLERVSHSEINKNDYYTMSAKGVTHFKDGEAGM